MDKYDIRLEYDHQWIDHPLQIITKINHKVIQVDVSGHNNVVINKRIPLENNSHVMTMQIGNKNEANTQVDRDGNIIKDTTIELKSLQINSIELMPLLYHSEQFAGFYINGQDNQYKTKMGNFGYNGIWEFKFETPIYDWMLEHLF